jgi:hypothetical protein|tara:strand:+ start:100 stop:387 length:288 start_codon:yes stop_codon:yes gene_type:complete
MKFKIKDKEINVEPATLRQIAELEKSVGSLQDIGTNKPVESIVAIVGLIIKSYPQDEGMTIDWILDNCNMQEIQSLNDVVTHFLGVSPTEDNPNS